MALSQQKRGEVARQLMADDPTLDYAIALTMVDEMDANGAFDEITNEPDMAPQGEVAPWDQTPIAAPEQELAPWERPADVAEVAPWERPDGPAPWDRPVEEAPLEQPFYETQEDEVVQVGNVPFYLSPTSQNTGTASEDLVRGLDGAMEYAEPSPDGNAEEQRFRTGHRQRSQELRDTVTAPIKMIKNFLDDPWAGQEVLGEDGAKEFETAPAEHTMEAGVERNKEATKGILHNLAIERMADKIENGEVANYDEELKAVTDDFRGDARELSTDIALTIATVMTGGLTGPVAAQRLITRYPKAAKYILSALESAGIMTVAGVAGNTGADRDLFEGTATDATVGAIFGAAGPAVVDAVSGIKSIFKPAVKSKDVGKVAEELISEKEMRTIVRGEQRDINMLSEVAKDLKKGFDNVNPEQIRNLDALPDGPVRDNLRALKGGMSPEDQAKQAEAIEFFKNKDNLARLDDEIADVKYRVGRIQDAADDKYTALATLMDQGRGGRYAVDTSYIDDTLVGKTGRLIEEQAGFGVPKMIRQHNFNKAQDKVRSNTVDELEQFLEVQRNKLAGEGLGRSERKGIRHQERELRNVKDALEKGKNIKESDFSRGWEYLPDSLKKSLDETVSLQNYSKSFKGPKKEASVVVDKAPKYAAQVALGVATGGAYWGKQLAAGVAIPALRGLRQSTKKEVIQRANNLVKKYDGDLDKIMKEVQEMDTEMGSHVLSALMFRISAGEEMGEYVDDNMFSESAPEWQE